MIFFGKGLQKKLEVNPGLKEFVWLTRITNDTPTLISLVAENRYYVALCSAAVKGDNNADISQISMYQDLLAESHRRGFSFEDIRDKLMPVAAAIGLHNNPPGAIQADYYKILNVSPNADLRTVKKAYRVRARQAHPDTRRDENVLFQSVQEAYAVLSNPSLRRQYDFSRKQRNNTQWRESAFSGCVVAHAGGVLSSRRRIFRHICITLFVVALLAVITMIADFVLRQQSLNEDTIRREVWGITAE